MKKILFATDLDGSLISEQKVDDAVPVLQTSHGCSYILPKNLELLEMIMEHADVVPLTARCESSFSKFTINGRFNNALLENGAILLNNGIPDKEWESESERMVRAGENKKKILEDYFEGNGYDKKSSSKFIIDYINNGICGRENELHYKKIIKLAGGEFDVNICNPHQIYLTHKLIDKSISLQRFLAKHPYNLVITCGDTAADWGMLEKYLGIGPSDSPARYRFPHTHAENEHGFTTFALSMALKIINGFLT